MIETGEAAPDFALQDQSGREMRLSALRGGRVLLVFYAKDGTTGCDRELDDFNAALPAFAKAGVTVLAISPDSQPRHAAHAAKRGLELPLLADPDHAVIAAYGLWQQKKLYGREYMGVIRASVLVSAEGLVERVWKVSRIAGHAEAALAAVASGG